jgi:hypothetical protein
MKCVGLLACMVKMRNAYKILGKRPFGGPWRRWHDDIKMDDKETECESVD